MDLVSIRIITDDLDRLVGFYERITGVAAVRYTPVFAELRCRRSRLPSVTVRPRDCSVRIRRGLPTTAV